MLVFPAVFLATWAACFVGFTHEGGNFDQGRRLSPWVRVYAATGTALIVMAVFGIPLALAARDLLD
jgi:hypothetical protein